MTGTEILPATASRADWLAGRLNGIGASEIAAVLGLSPWDSPFSLFYRKVGAWDPPQNAEMEAGTRLETAVADWWAEKHLAPGLTMAQSGLWQSEARPWQMATPDRLIYRVTRRPGKARVVEAVAVLECKVAYNWDGWGEPGTDQIPLHYRAQGLWQMDTVGVDVTYFAAFSNMELRCYELHRDDTDLKLMRAAGGEFWARVLAQDPPDLDSHPSNIRVLKALHPTLADRKQLVSADTAAGYREAKALLDQAKANASEWEARLRQEMGDAKYGFDPEGRKIASRSVFDRTSYTMPAATIDRINLDRSNHG